MISLFLSPEFEHTLKFFLPFCALYFTWPGYWQRISFKVAVPELLDRNRLILEHDTFKFVTVAGVVWFLRSSRMYIIVVSSRACCKPSMSCHLSLRLISNWSNIFRVLLSATAPERIKGLCRIFPREPTQIKLVWLVSVSAVFFLIYCSKMYRFLYMKINKEVFNNQMFLFDFVKVFANAFLSLYTYFLLHLIQSIVLSWNIELITMCLFQVCFVSTLSTWEAKRY